MLFLAPFVICVIAMEYFLRKIPNSHMIKANEFKLEASKVKILILGNSHTLNAINPEYLSKDAYNLSQAAQTLDVDYALLHKYENQLKSLEYIVIPVSYQSLWIKLSDEGYFKWTAKYNNIYFNLAIENNPLNTFLIRDNTMINNLKHLKSYYLDNISENINLIRGFMPAKPSISLEKTTENGKIKAKAYTFDNLNYLYRENIDNLLKMINIARRKNAKIIFITIPCYTTFLDNMNKKQLDIIHTTMNNIKNNKDIFYYDMLEDARGYTLEDFSNGDHLSYKGAKKVSMKLDSIIRSIDKK